VGSAYFFGGQQLVDLAARLKNGRLEGARGAGALSVALLVTFAGCGGAQEMGADKAQHEAGYDCQFLAALECPQQRCSGGRAEGLVHKRAYSAAVDVASTLAAIATGRLLVGPLVGVVGGVVALRGIIQSPVRVHLLAHSTMRLRYDMVHPVLVKAISQPALQSVTTKMREWDAKLGMMWARQAAAGSAGMSNVHVCVDVTHSPLGSWATMGLVVGVMLVPGAVDVRKWLVAPELRMAQFLRASTSNFTVRSRAAAARACLGDGVGQQEDKLRFNLVVSSLAAPNRQKLLNHAGFAGGGAKLYKGGGVIVGVVVGKG
jgi:hypothetical protein